VREECHIMVRRNGLLEMCGQLSVCSTPCSCDRCEIEPGFHLPMHWCAEHWDKITNPPMRCSNCGSSNHHPCDCPEPLSFLEVS
jgi:hypothetical protein